MRLSLLALLSCSTAFADMKSEPFGKLPDGREVQRFTLTNTNGMSAKVMSYGAILTELHVPDKDGQLADVVLGFDTLDGYLKGHPYFGANVGRCANRIAEGKFTLDGKPYTLATNNGKNHLHGGKEGFDKKLWTVAGNAKHNTLSFQYSSPDGEEGYPGQLDVTITYSLNADNSLTIAYHATCDKATICNLAHHSYFNLAGRGDILKHVLTIPAETYTPADGTLVPTGKLAPVKGTPLDFTVAAEIGSRLKEIKADPVGYDHNYCIGKPDGLNHAATVLEPTSGRIMKITTSEPGLQFYTGNFLDGKLTGKNSTIYQQYSGFCLEAQKFPDAANKIGAPGWDSPVLKPGSEYNAFITFAFSIRK